MSEDDVLLPVLWKVAGRLQIAYLSMEVVGLLLATVAVVERGKEATRALLLTLAMAMTSTCHSAIFIVIDFHEWKTGDELLCRWLQKSAPCFYVLFTMALNLFLYERVLIVNEEQAQSFLMKNAKMMTLSMVVSIPVAVYFFDSLMLPEQRVCLSVIPVWLTIVVALANFNLGAFLSVSFYQGLMGHYKNMAECSAASANRNDTPLARPHGRRVQRGSIISSVFVSKRTSPDKLSSSSVLPQSARSAHSQDQQNERLKELAWKNMILSTIVIATSLTAMGIDVWVNIAVIPGRHWLLQLENITSNLDIAVAFFMTLIISSQWLPKHLKAMIRFCSVS
ncbi:G-protein coupled receptors family 1 profile domain-containing protein [Plasmodiophora brassicae]|nr:hypothetical protein PBRA_000045 [Plasmodiophora brassicae]